MKNRIAYCGLDCEQCDAYLATINNDPVLREKTARLWSDLNETCILPEQIHCNGCRQEGIKTVFCESLCSIRQCALKREVRTCGDCAKIEECSVIGAIISNNPQAMKNLQLNFKERNGK